MSNALGGRAWRRRRPVALVLLLAALLLGIPWLTGTPLVSFSDLESEQDHSDQVLLTEAVPAPEPGQRKVVLERLGMT